MRCVSTRKDVSSVCATNKEAWGLPGSGQAVERSSLRKVTCIFTWLEKGEIDD